MTYPQIRNLARYGNGWTWDVVDREWHTDLLITNTYRTNGSGQGLWREVYTPYGGYDGWRQIAGTSQFSLPSSPTGARRVIRYEFASALGRFTR